MNMRKTGVKGSLMLMALAVLVAAAGPWFGHVVLASNFAVNVSNALTTNPDYAVLQYATNITCPQGNFSKYSGAPNNFCVHNPSGQLIAGWEVFNLTALRNVTVINVTGSEFNIGCTSCANSVDVKVFTAQGTTYDSGTVWSYAGTCTFADNANNVVCTIAHSKNNVGLVMITRWQGGDFRPDPAVNLVTVG
ncbi:hypothetical protein HY989_03060 [Candidatus Micrarchaeota archaeon]|nr:hypothetical protein [Candidatus Micrarchaeota archaeon]